MLGQIECGHRRDGPLLDEDRRLLASLADRISIVNGALQIVTGPGRGTTLRAEVPLAAAGPADG